MTTMRLSALLVVWCAVSVASADPVDDYVRARLRSTRLPGVSVAVVKDGRIVKAEGYGKASLELDAPATAETVYEIGSISKQIAADAILLLRDEGRLDLDDPIAKYIDNTPAAWAPITLRHVLTHTAGLADFDTGNFGFSYRREYTGAEFVALLGIQPLTFAPGTRWNYTNAFPLLGLVVERVSGQPYAEFVRTRIFVPLGLTSARFKIATDVVPRRADGYVWRDGAYHHGEPLRPQVIAANGGVMMNVVDFATWDIAVSRGRLLRPATVTEMSTPVRLADGTTVSHGLGWFMDTFNGHRFGAHWGTTVTGHSAVIRRYDEGVTVIVLGNLDDGGLAVDAMSKHIANLYLPGTAIEGLTPGPDPDDAETTRLRRALAAVAKGEDAPGAVPGLGQRLPATARERLAAALAPSTRVESLGEERLTPYHFNLDPAIVRLRRYRATTPAWTRYLTVRLAADGTVRGVLVEEE
jgi:CubicO group peptidase (beta-lactamase class C family)